MNTWELIFKSPHSLLYKDESAQNGLPMLIKLTREKFPSDSQVKQLQNEFELTRNLNIKGVRKALRLSTIEDREALYLEYIPGETLRQAFVHRRRTLDEILPMAVEVTQILVELHHRRIVHQDITSLNILYSEQRGEKHSYLIDFGIAHRVGENSSWAPNAHAHASLAYISPEQTGRTDREIDARSDLYSWGITLYEVLTGQLPFIHDDPAEWVHAHLAQQPIAPHLVNQLESIPELLSQIVLKLLAKNPDDRYQSAIGLESDLLRCWEQWQHAQQIPSFPLGLADLKDTFEVSPKLYERKTHMAKMREIYDQVTQGKVEWVLLEGPPGVGKTRLAKEMISLVGEKKGFYIHGRFDTLQQNNPYAAWIQAFEELVNKLLISDEEQLSYWRQLIQKAIGNNGKLLTDVIPRLELIIGPQKQTEAPLGAWQLQNRFNLVFQNFIDSLSVKGHSLLVFIDDWQWADPASLDLLKTLLSTPKNDYFCIICAYRSDEVGDDHLFTHTRNELEAKGITPHVIQLGDLSLNAVGQLISDSLACTPEEVSSLAEAVYEKTHGNAFFVKQMLYSLSEDNYLHWKPGMMPSWDLDAIRQLSSTDNVGTLMTYRLNRLNESTRNVLKLAALLGNSFERTLILGFGKEQLGNVSHELDLLVREGMLIWIQANSRKPSIPKYKFTHKGIRRAVYQIMSEIERSQLHYELGYWLWKAIYPQQKKLIFDIAKHFRLGYAHWCSLRERRKARLSQLDWIQVYRDAAARAKASKAFDSGRKFLAQARMGIDESLWENNYKLLFELFLESAELNALHGAFDRSEALIRYSLKRAAHPLDEARAYDLLLQHHRTRSNYAEAFRAATEALNRLGFSLRENEASLFASIKAEKLRNWQEQSEMSMLLDRPVLADQRINYAVRILNKVEIAVLWSFSQELWSLVVLHAFELVLKHGHETEAAYAYVNYAHYIGTVERNYERAYELGQLALKRSLEQEDSIQQARTLFKVGAYLQPWKRPLSDAIETLEQGFSTAKKSGAWLFVGYHLSYLGLYTPLSGISIPQMLTRLQEGLGFSRRIQHRFALQVLGLMEASLHVWDGSLDLDRFMLQRETVLAQLDPKGGSQQNAFFRSLWNLQAAKLQFAYHHFDEAHRLITLSDSSLSGIKNTFYEVETLFWQYLIDFTYQDRTAESRPGIAPEDALKFEVWIQACPTNVEHKWLLLQAEYARTQSDVWGASQFYDRASAAAAQQGFVHDEALIHELAARMWWQKGKTEFAKPYLSKASYYYARWGAHHKEKHLRSAYASSFEQVESLPVSPEHKETSNTAAWVDAATLTKASQAFAGEIVLSNLLKKMMGIVMENAGATYGVFVEKSEQVWTIKARGTLESGIEVLEGLNLVKDNRLPLSVINYVLRTKEPLTLTHATEHPVYMQDAYIQQKDIKSILCFPIRNQGSLIALLYLENNLSTGVFTSEHQEVLQLLSSQIAISLQNANLYQRLEEKVKQRTVELQAKNIELVDTLNRLQDTQSQLVDSAKMASLGNLTAGIAHEINNPINFVSSSISPLEADFKELHQLLLDIRASVKEHPDPSGVQEIANMIQEAELPYVFVEIEQLLQGIRQGATRTRSIVEGLKVFSRSWTDSFKRVDIHKGLEATLMLLKHRLKDRIEVALAFDAVSEIECIPGKLNEVFMNILTNAVQAIEQVEGGRGKISIRTAEREDKLYIAFTDSGIGMKEEIIPHIFEPFYTTKDIGDGVGLGLSISYGIVEQHKGQIEVQSEWQKGSTFTLVLPIKQLKYHEPIFEENR